MSQPPAAPLVLASTSPQRRAILEQLAIPFDVVPPAYEERASDADAIALVREHARGKARSVAAEAGDRPVLGVDSVVVLDRDVFGKPANASEAESMLEALSGQTHEVVSGLCLLAPAAVSPSWEVVEHAITRVVFRTLTPRELARYLASGEWQGRAGAYAIQGLGAMLVERIEGDYLNVVGLPVSLLARVLAERFAGVYGFG